MYSSWERSLKTEKPRKNHRSPSFSSSLLDEIYRSIDGAEEKSEEFKSYKEKKKLGGGGGNGGVKAKISSIEDEEMASFKRACLIEKWMEKKVEDKVLASRSRRLSSLPEVEDNDSTFFTSSSSSSDSSSGQLSSSETEFFAPPKSRSSCFTAPRPPKPVKTSVSVSPKMGKNIQNPLYRDQNELYLFDDYGNYRTSKSEESLIKSKSRALKIYANLKKVKQPISPGGRLTSFINSLFTNGNAKKMKNPNGDEDANTERTSKSAQASTCSSASSFSRSCLIKTSPNSRAKINNDGVKRTVRFCPISVIVDEDCRPCGHKSLCDENLGRYGSSLPTNLRLMEQNLKIQEAARDYLNQKMNNNEEDDDDDAASDSSSDLFELDHLELFGNDRYREELPVYETTHVQTNRAISSRLIR